VLDMIETPLVDRKIAAACGDVGCSPAPKLIPLPGYRLRRTLLNLQILA
jgi:hypothetical protein